MPIQLTPWKPVIVAAKKTAPRTAVPAAAKTPKAPAVKRERSPRSVVAKVAAAAKAPDGYDLIAASPRLSDVVVKRREARKADRDGAYEIKHEFRDNRVVYLLVKPSADGTTANDDAPDINPEIVDDTTADEALAALDNLEGVTV
jgi:hypothetical protein